MNTSKAVDVVSPLTPRRSHPAQPWRGLWCPANLIAQRFRAPEGDYILSLRARERIGEKCGAFFNGKKRCQWVQWMLAFKLPSAARFINKEGRDDNHSTLHASHQLALCKRKSLEMQTTHHTIRTHALIVLAELHLVAYQWLYFLRSLKLSKK